MVYSKNETRWMKQTQDITIFPISVHAVNIQNKKFELEVCVSVLVPNWTIATFTIIM